MTNKEFDKLSKKYPYGFVVSYQGSDLEVKKLLKKGLLVVKRVSHWSKLFEGPQLKRKVTNKGYTYDDGTLEVDPIEWTVDKEATKKKLALRKILSAAQKKRAKQNEDTRAMKRAQTHLPKVLDKYIQNIQYVKPYSKLNKLLNDMPLWHRFTVLSKLSVKQRAALALIEQKFEDVAKIIVDGVVEDEDEK